MLHAASSPTHRTSAFALGLALLALVFGPAPLRADGPHRPAGAAHRPSAPAHSPAPVPAADPSDFSHYADIVATWPPEITAAAKTLFGRPQQSWSWSYLSVTEDGTEEYLWDPARPARERSILLAKDGAPASAKEKDAHLAERAERETRREKTSPAERIARARALLATLEFQRLEDTELTSTWQVTSRAVDTDSLPLSERIRNRVLAALRGRIVVSKTPPGLIEIALQNPEPIRATVSVRFSEVDLLLRNALQPGTDVFLPVEISGKLHGRYLYLGKIDRTWNVTLRNHAPVKSAPASSVPGVGGGALP